MRQTLVRDVAAAGDETADPLASRVVDHVRFHVGNAMQAVHYYATAFGMCPIAYRGPETGQPGIREYVLASGTARFVVAGEVEGGTPLGWDVAEHGDAVADIALATSGVSAAVAQARARGIDVVEDLHEASDATGDVLLATLQLPDGARHTLVDRSAYQGLFLPGFTAVPHAFRAKPPHHPQHYVEAVDHWSGAAGPGVRHLALATADIVRTVLAMTEMGVEFAPAPDDQVRVDTRVPPETLRELGIQVAPDGDGYLLRTFTRPVQDRPPLVFELVEHHRAGEDEL
jgi:4-hydroxyphenylpyruvate dioxygenase-like putative hemolysin